MIINLTQHDASPEQIAAGVHDLDDLDYRADLRRLLTFDDLPTLDEMAERAEEIVDIVQMQEALYSHAMIGGAPFFMATLEGALRDAEITPLYAFSRRESVESVETDGSVNKRAVFRHLGFVEGGA